MGAPDRLRSVSADSRIWVVQASLQQPIGGRVGQFCQGSGGMRTEETFIAPPRIADQAERKHVKEDGVFLCLRRRYRRVICKGLLRSLGLDSHEDLCAARFGGKRVLRQVVGQEAKGLGTLASEG